MTEEKRELIDFINQEIDKWDDERRYVRVLEIALAALTQPASRALKLPEVPPNALVALCEQMYDHRSTGVTVAHDVWQDCIEELRIDAPHTAPIEPICATGGAEWVKCSDRMPDDDTLCLGIDADGVIWTMHYDCGELVTDTCTAAPPDITHWMPLPSPPALPL